MSCGCVPRLFRKATRTSPSPLGLLPSKSESEELLLSDPTPEEPTPNLPREDKLIETEITADVNATIEVLKNEDKPISPEKRNINLRNGAQIFRSLFRPSSPDPSSWWIKCEFLVDEIHRTIQLGFKITDEVPKKREMPLNLLFRIRNRKKEDAELAETSRSRPASVASNSQIDDEETTKKSGFCFGWGYSWDIDDDDEAIISNTTESVILEAPPGLVGLLNLGNTCFLSAALQCLRCTPGLATAVVPELEKGFELKKYQLVNSDFHDGKFLTRIRPNSFSYYSKSGDSEDLALLARSTSLPCPLPDELSGKLEGESGLAGGSIFRLADPSTNNEDLRETNAASDAATHQDNAISSEGMIKAESETSVQPRDQSEMQDESTKSAENEESKEESPQGGLSKDEKTLEDLLEDMSEDFISAFQKLVLGICLGERDTHHSPRDLYLQLKKIPQGEWICDGGQHDCQEAIKVLLNAIHDSFAKKSSSEELGEVVGRCMSDVAEGTVEALHAIEVEILKANSMWKRYLLTDLSPVTDVFAGQLQIVRSCQKCNCRSTTYEPFWDLSLSLSREKATWFNPGRMPSSLEDLLRAFTAAEVLQGDEAPFCECCDSKSPATRRILIHRFPKVLVLNIKRFKYTKDGREKLTCKISFPIKSLRLQNFASKEHQHEGPNEVYDLYAVSNHFGTLGGGHYTACCKIRESERKEGWYCFNDKVVTKIKEESVASPHAYILFYARRSVTES